MLRTFALPRITTPYLARVKAKFKTSRVIQKANSSVLVTSDATENDIVFFAALERIDTGYFNLLVEIFLQCTIKLHVGDDIRALSFVSGDHSNLRRDDYRLKQLRNNLIDV